MSTAIAQSSPFTSEPLVSSNRRRSAREMSLTRGLLRSADTSARQSSHEVMVTDISLHGVGLRSAIDLHEGEYFHIEIGVGPLHLASRMRVTRCFARVDGYFDVGGEFC